MDLTDAAAAWRRDGFVVLPGYLDGPELRAAQRDLASVFPTAEDYHAAPGEGRNRVYTGDEFGGIIAFPFPTVALCRLVGRARPIPWPRPYTRPTTSASTRGNSGPGTTAERPATSRNITATT